MSAVDPGAPAPGDGPLDPETVGAPIEPPAPAPRRRGAAGALLVGLGIFVTRIFGLVRTRAMSTYLGTSDAADAFSTAIRIPNFLQNLFGEGVLSASFIPVYARLVAEGRRAEADRVAGAVLGLLAATVAVIAGVGVLAAPLVVDALATGFSGEKRALTITLVRIVFPGTAVLVLSAWCLGILNSHRRFFLSYASPIAWNVAIIGALVWGGGMRGLRGEALVTFVAWWTVVGSVAQFAVQLPTVLRLARVRPSLGRGSAHARTVVGNFAPAFVSRGAVQIGAFVDLNFASFLGEGAQSVMTYAQQIYLLPIGLFGMSIGAAQLAEMSRETGDAAAVHGALRERLDAGLRSVLFFIVPSAVAFLALGDVISGVILEGGAFGREDSRHVWLVLAGSSLGLVATTLARLYSSTFHALRDTRTPLRFAVVRIALGIALAWVLAFPVRQALGLDGIWGVAGITAASGVAGWVEFALLRRALRGRIGGTPAPVGHAVRVWAAAVAAAVAAWGVKVAVAGRPPLVAGLAVLGAFGLAYLAATVVVGVPEARAVVARARRMAGGRR